MTTPAQELPENQHDDQVHVDAVTGAVTPIRNFLAAEFARIKGDVQVEKTDEGNAKDAVEAEIARLKAEAKAEVEAVEAAGQKLVDEVKSDYEKAKEAAEAEIAKLKSQLEELKVKPAAKKTTTKAAEAKPSAVRETGDIK